MAALVLGTGLWVFHFSVDGVPGPVLAGEYISGFADLEVVVGYAAPAAALATIAAIMIARVEDNRVGWILGGMAIWMVSTFLLTMFIYFFNSEGAPGWHFANWLGTWPFVVGVASGLVLMYFPDGELISPRWRTLPWVTVVGFAGWALSEASTSRLGLEGEIPNAYASARLEGIGNALALLILAAVIGTVASLVVRFRDSTPDARLQLKWVAVGGVLQLAVLLGLWMIDILTPGEFPASAAIAGSLSTLIVPITLSVAILRFRLYAIDRIVSRTASYAVLAALLAAGTFGVVIGTQALFGFSNDLVVAGTTLALVAVFNPVRRRLHRIMDQKFNRSAFDAERVTQALAARLQDTTSMDDLVSELESTLQATFAPTTIGIWIRR
jgi:hypothetical protein